jgi:hypothetical protein
MPAVATASFPSRASGAASAPRAAADAWRIQRAHLVDCVLPEVPIRQWVLTLPYPLRYRCAYNARLTSQVLRAFLRALFAEFRRPASAQWNMAQGQCGAVTFIQRFGSALNPNVHYHTLALDDVQE